MKDLLHIAFKNHKQMKIPLHIIFVFFPILIFANNSEKIIISEFLASNSTVIKDVDGEYSDWIEIYNPGNEIINLSGWSLTDSKKTPRQWLFPQVTIGPGKYMILFASGKDSIYSNNEIHTNFSLSKDGEYLAIIEPNGIISHEYSPAYPPQQSDISFGYYQARLAFFEVPSPGAENSTISRPKIPVFSKTRGFFNDSFTVSLTVSDPETKIFYTTDGTRPSEKSMPYSNSITIEKTTPLSAVGIKDGLISSVVTNTYFFTKDIVKQPENPIGYPSQWGFLGADIKLNNYKAGDRAPADYAMDPNVCNDPAYKSQIDNAFNSIPSVSIVTNPGYLFSDTTDENEGGIYIHTGVTLGDGWERPISLEYFEPSTGKQFQINCGLRLHGAASRQPEKSGKHSFRASFKGIYGETKLNFKLFDEETAVDKFDDLVFRAGYNLSWLHPESKQRSNSQYTNDSFAKNIQRNMGHISTHNRFVHLYLNGLYWGLYDISERLNDKFMKSYFADESTNFDVINHDGLSDGEITAYNRTTELAKNGNYNQLLSEKLLYVENYIDYMLINFYIGNLDWATNNWYMARNRINPENGFYSFCWDSENSLSDVNLNRINGSNGFQGNFRSILFGSSSGTSTERGLYKNEDFKLLFADRVQKHFFNNGSLTPEKTAETYRKLVDEIDLAVILESARWGDYRKNTLTPLGTQPPLYTRNDHWIPRRDKLLSDYFPKRTDVVYKQLKELGLVSQIEPPIFSSYGGVLNNTVELTMTAKNGTVYYSINGADPREQGSGELAVWALEYKKPLQIKDACNIRARSKNGTVWSALTEASFIRENISGSSFIAESIPQIYYQNNAMHIYIPKEADISLVIYSIDGRSLQSINTFCETGNNRIELSNLPKGVYVYKLLIERNSYVDKFVK